MTAQELDTFTNTFRKFVPVESRIQIEQQINRFIYALEAIDRTELTSELENFVREIDRIPTEEVIKQGTFK